MVAGQTWGSGTEDMCQAWLRELADGGAHRTLQTEDTNDGLGGGGC